MPPCLDQIFLLLWKLLLTIERMGDDAGEVKEGGFEPIFDADIIMTDE